MEEAGLGCGSGQLFLAWVQSTEACVALWVSEVNLVRVNKASANFAGPTVPKCKTKARAKALVASLTWSCMA